MGNSILFGKPHTVVSQIGRQVFGSGPFYLVLQAATTMILLLAANTSFADFPRLSALLARARYLPRQLAALGDRLVFSNGIVLLGLVSSALVVLFGGQTHRLIPLYAVGVFLSFTLSQAGMVRRWYTKKGEGWQWKALVNGLGAVATGIVLTVIVGTKFVHGAWIVVLLIPTLVWVFHSINLHYRAVAAQLSLDNVEPEEWQGVSKERWHKVVVPVSSLHRGALTALRFARTLSTDVTAVSVDVDPQAIARLRDKWRKWAYDIPLVVMESPYRSVVRPLLAYLDTVDQRDPERGLAVVVLPEFVPARWPHHLLHNQTAFLVKTLLIYQRGQGGKDRVIINVPYHLQR